MNESRNHWCGGRGSGPEQYATNDGVGVPPEPIQLGWQIEHADKLWLDIVTGNLGAPHLGLGVLWGYTVLVEDRDRRRTP